jgi:mono/diheme cytochrome c family protein
MSFMEASSSSGTVGQTSKEWHVTSTRLILILLLALMLFAGACGEGTTREPPVIEPSATESSATDSPATTAADSSTEDAVAAGTPTGMGRGVGRTSGMMERHRATIPAEYAGLTNPIEADEESLDRGAEAYASCAACHGDTGLGDGPASLSLDPAATNIARTSQMMGDDYLFWRISEGGAPFDTLMPAWEATLDEQTRWDLINYIQSLETGTVGQASGRGGQGLNSQTQAARQAAQQAALLAAAVDQEFITQDEADAFAEAHEPVDARMAELRGTNPGQGVDDLLEDVLSELVSSGDLTQDQADTFLSVHDRLSEAGLLP